MDQQQIKEATNALMDLGQCFWAGEAEIARLFWSTPRSAEEEARWIRLQVFKEMYGSGLSGHPDGIIRGLIASLDDDLGSMIETKEQRSEYERTIRVLREEFTHFRLFADLLEDVTGERARMSELRNWQYPEDRKLQELRSAYRKNEGVLGAAAIAFTEGGGSAVFYEGRKLKGSTLLDRIAAACNVIYTDELEHGEHGAQELEEQLHEAAKSPADLQKVKQMVTAICQQRLRMRFDMFGLAVHEQRITEISAGNIRPLRIYA